MEYLIQAFIRKLNQYSFIKPLYQKVNGKHEILLFDIPTRVDVKLVNESIPVIVGYEEKTTTVKGYTYSYKEKIVKYEKMVTPQFDHINGRTLKVILDKETYAKKINKIDIILREYNAKYNSKIKA